MFSLICAWTNAWANNRDAGDMRCNRAHYDVIVMIIRVFVTLKPKIPCMMLASTMSAIFNTLRSKQNGRHFAGDISLFMFLYENCCIWIKMSLKIVTKILFNNMPALLQIIAWHQRRLAGLYLNQWWRSLPMHLCVTWPQWVRILILSYYACTLYLTSYIADIYKTCVSLFYFELICRRRADISSHSGHFPVHAPDPAWSLSDLFATKSWALVIW